VGTSTTSTGEATRCASRESTGTLAAGRATSRGVEALHDGVRNRLELLLLLFVLLLRALLRSVEPLDGVVDGAVELGLVRGVELARELLVLSRITEVVGIRLEGVLGGNAGSGSLVISLVLLGVRNHALDLLLRQTALVVGDGDAVALAGGLVGSRDV